MNKVGSTTPSGESVSQKDFDQRVIHAEGAALTRKELFFDGRDIDVDDQGLMKLQLGQNILDSFKSGTGANDFIKFKDLLLYDIFSLQACLVFQHVTILVKFYLINPLESNNHCTVGGVLFP
ncbi:hypothetical protein Tco_0004515 [Tanacetum coccineum]